MGDQRHYDAGACKVLDDIGHLFDHLGVQRAGRLIKEDDLGSIARVRAMAVSYTHLDVYKRQVPGSGMATKIKRAT